MAFLRSSAQTKEIALISAPEALLLLPVQADIKRNGL
jgi:hypothetical protein